MWFGLARFWIRRGEIKCIALVHTSCLDGHSAQQESLTVLLTPVNVLAVTKLIAVGAFCFKRVTESKGRCRYWTLVLLKKIQGVCVLPSEALAFFLATVNYRDGCPYFNQSISQMLHLSRTTTMQCSQHRPDSNSWWEISSLPVHPTNYTRKKRSKWTESVCFIYISFHSHHILVMRSFERSSCEDLIDSTQIVLCQKEIQSRFCLNCFARTLLSPFGFGNFKC